MNESLTKPLPAGISSDGPRVSVLLPVYNGARYVRDAIDSILGQSYRDFEFLIINDGSTDGTREILDSLVDPRVRVFHKHNEGLGKTLNRGLKLATGEYVARIDADDAAEPERLKRQVEYLESHPDIAVLGTALKVSYSDGTEVIRQRPLRQEDVLRHIIKVCPVAHPSVMMRRSVILGLGGYDVSHDGSLGRSAGMDYHLWVRVLANGYGLANLPDPLVIHRKVATSITGKKSLSFKLFERARLRLWAKRELRLGARAYIDVLLVSIMTVFNQYGLKLDRIFNLLSRYRN